MTRDQLISALQKLPENLPIVFKDQDSDLVTMNFITLTTVGERKDQFDEVLDVYVNLQEDLPKLRIAKDGEKVYELSIEPDPVA